MIYDAQLALMTEFHCLLMLMISNYRYGPNRSNPARAR